MTHFLEFNYDDRDFLEIWLPDFDSESHYEYEAGRYEHASSARRKGSNRSFDNLMVDAFSRTYPEVIEEVSRKEPPVELENYNVPYLNIDQVLLSEVLKHIFQKFVIEKHHNLKPISEADIAH